MSPISSVPTFRLSLVRYVLSEKYALLNWPLKRENCCVYLGMAIWKKAWGERDKLGAIRFCPFPALFLLYWSLKHSPILQRPKTMKLWDEQYYGTFSVSPFCLTEFALRRECPLRGNHAEYSYYQVVFITSRIMAGRTYPSKYNDVAF